MWARRVRGLSQEELHVLGRRSPLACSPHRPCAPHRRGRRSYSARTDSQDAQNASAAARSASQTPARSGEGSTAFSDDTRVRMMTSRRDKKQRLGEQHVDPTAGAAAAAASSSLVA